MQIANNFQIQQNFSSKNPSVITRSFANLIGDLKLEQFPVAERKLSNDFSKSIQNEIWEDVKKHAMDFIEETFRLKRIENPLAGKTDISRADLVRALNKIDRMG